MIERLFVLADSDVYCGPDFEQGDRMTASPPSGRSIVGRRGRCAEAHA